MISISIEVNDKEFALVIKNINDWITFIASDPEEIGLKEIIKKTNIFVMSSSGQYKGDKNAFLFFLDKQKI